MKATVLPASALLLTSVACNAQRVLDAQPLPWTTAFPASSALFFDLEALSDPVAIEGFTTALDMGPGEQFMLEIWVREGTSLGGTATSGPGYSQDGWTSLGFAYGVQGSPFGGICPPVTIPRILVRPGHITGVALNFDTGAPASIGSSSYLRFQNDALRLTTGDVRSPTFTLGQHYFPRAVLIGSIIYDLAPCYPNCDGSTTDPVLNVNDFICFLSSYARGDSYANCDASTTPPILNVNDFLCFTQQFAAGCS